MNIFSHLSFTAAFLHLIVGILAYLRDRRAFQNQLFLLLSISFALWALANSIAISAADIESVWRTYSYFSWIFFLFPALFLHFSFYLSGSCSWICKWKALILYLPGLLLYLFSGTGLAIIEEFRSSQFGWTITYNRDSLWYYFHVFYYSAYFIASLIIYTTWYRRSKSLREKKQVKAILLSLGTAFGLSTIFGTAIPLFRASPIPPLGPVFMLVWVFGMAYAILKFRLLHPGPDVAFFTILQHIHDMVLLSNAEGRVIYANKMFQDISKYSQSKISRLKTEKLFPLLTSLSRNEPENDTKNSLQQTILKTKTGDFIPVSLSISQLFDPHSDLIGYVFTAHDRRTILKLEKEKELHRQTAQELRTSEEKFMKAFYQNPIGMALIDPQTHKIEMINTNGKELFQMKGSEGADYPVLKWKSETQGLAFFNQIHELGRVDAFPTQIIKADGEIADIILSGDKITSSGSLYYLCYFLDLTYLNQMENELISMQKFETVALMAGGIAHDFNNMLTSIQGNLGLAKHFTSHLREVQELLGSADQACALASDLTTKLLSFSKQSTPHRKMIDLISLLKESLQLTVQDKKIKVHLNAPQESVLVQADKIQLLQVFNNLFLNAKQAMPGGGRLSVEVSTFSTSSMKEKRNAPSHLVAPGEYIQLRICDTGHGVPKEKQARLFDPYFTTKEEGTGLGLTVVYSILSKHGGTIEVESVDGEGTCFTLYLPSSVNELNLSE